MVDERFAEREQKEPLDVLSADALQAAGECEGWQHDCRGNGQTQGDERRDGHVLLGEEELLGEYETYAPEDDGGCYEDVGECL